MMGRTPLKALGIAASVATGAFSQAASQGTAQPTNSLNPLRAIERSKLKGFVERPLFDPTRRQSPAMPVAATPPAATTEPPPALQLLGVIHGKRDMAIVRRDGDERTMTLHTGDHFDGWTVTVVPPVGLHLKSGDRTSDYVMFGKGGGVPGLHVPNSGATDADDAGASDPFAHPLDKE